MGLQAGARQMPTACAAVGNAFLCSHTLLLLLLLLLLMTMLVLLPLLLLLLLLLQAILREAAGRKWVDPTLSEWPENDFRIFVGDLGNEVNDDALGKAFQRYPSFAKAKVCCSKQSMDLGAR
jgi:hypothetical protein